MPSSVRLPPTSSTYERAPTSTWLSSPTQARQLLLSRSTNGKETSSAYNGHGPCHLLYKRVRVGNPPRRRHDVRVRPQSEHVGRPLEAGRRQSSQLRGRAG